MTHKEYIEHLIDETDKLLVPMFMGNSQQEWSGEDKPGPMLANRPLWGVDVIRTGGTGDEPIRDKAGKNIIGYKSKGSGGSLTPGLDRLKQMQNASKAGAPLETASGFPGLDAQKAMNKNNPMFGVHSWDKPSVQVATPAGPKLPKTTAAIMIEDRAKRNPADLVKRLFPELQQ